jgi:hypothetical protein
LRPHWESAVPRCIGCWLPIPMTPGSSSGENLDGGMAAPFPGWGVHRDVASRRRS